MENSHLTIDVETKAGKDEITIMYSRLVCAGWVGRDREALQAHIDELAELGVPAPGRTPIFMNFSPYLVSTANHVDVISEETSGEIEYVILKDKEKIYVGVGSDHTDRGFEKYSIAASKQMYPKLMAPVIWPYEEIEDHWDQLILRSRMTKDGERILYQEDPISKILNVEELLDQIPKKDGLPTDGLIVFSGTIATKESLVFGEAFEVELEDPVLKRRIDHAYTVRVLPQYL
jgi:hypothetical protein